MSNKNIISDLRLLSKMLKASSQCNWIENDASEEFINIKAAVDRIINKYK